MWNTKITCLKFYPFNEHVSIEFTYCFNNGQGYSQNFTFSLWIILFSFTWRGMWEKLNLLYLCLFWFIRKYQYLQFISIDWNTLKIVIHKPTYYPLPRSQHNTKVRFLWTSVSFIKRIKVEAYSYSYSNKKNKNIE